MTIKHKNLVLLKNGDKVTYICAMKNIATGQEWFNGAVVANGKPSHFCKFTEADVAEVF